MWQEYYEKQLYPLQDKVLKVMAESNTKFYLTGGTALSRAYLYHRYSDDLDFFVNQDKDFEKETALILRVLQQHFTDVRVAMTYDTFARFFVQDFTQKVELKIEFVNDVLFHVGDVRQTSLFSHTDNLDNILSNKICALSREEAKDLADIWHIAQNFAFNWKEVIENAKQKDMWVDESQVLIFIENFDLAKLQDVKWIQPFDLKKAEKDMEFILKDILLGSENSLYQK
jgi:predicted nucleotidyltransferase component of viral defense system